MSEKKKVLFVDDNEMDRLILSKTLTQLDLDFKGVDNTEDFLQQIKPYNPDLCLVDLNINQPNDGRILVRALRNILGKELPIIVISAVEESSEVALNLQNGANDFICKPIDKSLLSSKIANFLHNDSIESRILPLFRLPAEECSKIEMPMELEMVAISEKDLTVRSHLSLVPGSTISLENNFLDEVFPEFPSFSFKILSRVNDEYTGTLLDLNSDHIQAFRMFLSRLQSANPAEKSQDPETTS
jgi:DNA-binding response OmpR family regulator